MSKTQPQNDRSSDLEEGATWGARLSDHRDRLCRVVAFRLDPRLRARIDAADVVQEAFLEAAAHREDYLRLDPPVPLFLWLRGVVNNKLLEIHRYHLGTRMRNAQREVPLCSGYSSRDETSGALAAHLSRQYTRPSMAAARAEVRARLEQALNGMNATHREVLALRHFEQLSNAEAAQVLGIQERAAAKRYLRALQRLKEVLSEMPGGLTEMRPWAS